MNGLGSKIAGKRKDMGITQQEFADMLSVTRQTVSRWEAGTVFPDIEKIADIAKTLNVSCDYLLRDDIEEDELRTAPCRHTERSTEGACHATYIRIRTT